METILNIPFIKRLSNDIAIDLGTRYCCVSSDASPQKYSEASYVAYDTNAKRIIAIGDKAKKMLGRTPPNIKVLSPIKNGITGNMEMSGILIEYMVRHVKCSGLIKPRFMAAVPEDSSEVERRSVLESLRLAGARIVYLIQQTIAAGIGADIPILEANGGIIADLGATSARIAVVSLGGIVEIKKTNSGGISMSNAITNLLANAHGMLVGELTAEKIKIHLGSAIPPEQKTTMVAKGRDIRTGLPVSAEITTDEVYNALRPSLRDITDTIRSCIETTPHDLINDIIEKGVTITGGVAHMRGLDRLITKATGVKCKIAPEPSAAITNGMKKIMASPKLMKFFFENSTDRIGEMN